VTWVDFDTRVYMSTSLRGKIMFLIFTSKNVIMINNNTYQSDNIGVEMLNCYYGTRILIVLVKNHTSQTVISKS
jgi:hypothetical protein